MTLDEIALAHGTDKASDGHGYARLYEKYLGHLRGGPASSLLELGVWEGASLRMWREWLSKARIVGVDKHDRDVEIVGVDIAIGSQDDTAFLAKVVADHGPFDVIVDDASHISSKTIASFKALWPAIKPGGIYVVEDLQTSYDLTYGRYESSPNPDKPPVPARRAGITAMQFCKRLADEVNRGLYLPRYYQGYEVGSVTFHSNICFITKAD